MHQMLQPPKSTLIKVLICTQTWLLSSWSMHHQYHIATLSLRHYTLSIRLLVWTCILFPCLCYSFPIVAPCICTRSILWWLHGPKYFHDVIICLGQADSLGPGWHVEIHTYYEGRCVCNLPGVVIVLTKVRTHHHCVSVYRSKCGTPWIILHCT